MNRPSLLSLALALPAFLVQSAAAADALPPASQWTPQETVLTLEISRPEALLDALLSPKLAEAVAAVPAYQQLQATPKFREFVGIITHLETQLGTDWRSALRKLLGGGVEFAAGTGGETLLSVDAQDAKMLEQLHDIFRAIVTGQAGQQGRVSSREHGGVTAWSFGPQDSHSIVGNRLLLANRPRVLDAVLDLRAQPSGKGLASSPFYQAAKKAVGPDAVGLAFINMQALKQNPGLQQALASGANPLTALLFAHQGKTLQQANWVAIGFYVRGDQLTLKVVTDGPAPDPAGPAGFATPRKPGEGILPNLDVPGRIAALSIYRDLHGFYAAKDALFPERTSGLIFFENMMGIFFSGMNLTEEVMGETQPEVRVVVAAQQYDPALGTPAVQFPGFAAVFRLRHPQVFGPVVEEAWQKALGLVNFTRGQKALPGLVIDRPTYGDAQFSVASFRPPSKTDPAGLDARYNFRPSLARVGDYLVLSSTDSLAKELIGALKKEAADRPAPSKTDHSLLDLDGKQLTAILNANRESMVRKSMVDKGSNRAQAEAETGLLFVVLDTLKQVRLSLGNEGGHPQAKLELKLKVPETKRSIATR